MPQAVNQVESIAAAIERYRYQLESLRPVIMGIYELISEAHNRNMQLAGEEGVQYYRQLANLYYAVNFKEAALTASEAHEQSRKVNILEAAHGYLDPEEGLNRTTISFNLFNRENYCTLIYFYLNLDEETRGSTSRLLHSLNVKMQNIVTDVSAVLDLFIPILDSKSSLINYEILRNARSLLINFCHDAEIMVGTRVDDVILSTHLLRTITKIIKFHIPEFNKALQLLNDSRSKLPSSSKLLQQAYDEARKEAAELAKEEATAARVAAALYKAERTVTTAPVRSPAAQAALAAHAAQSSQN